MHLRGSLTVKSNSGFRVWVCGKLEVNLGFFS